MQKKIILLYRKLYTEHGPQDWWPADSPYEVMVGAILTQNTNWKNVEKAIENLKREGLLEPNAILETGNQELETRSGSQNEKRITTRAKPCLETLIRPSGYYRQKAERLKLATKKWLELQDAKLKTGNRELETVELRNQWLSVKGIGPETADSILLYAFERPVFVIDAYTRRFCKHFDLFEGKGYDDYQEFFESNLPKDVELYKEYHALIVEWAKQNPKRKTRNCKPN